MRAQPPPSETSRTGARLGQPELAVGVLGAEPDHQPFSVTMAWRYSSQSGCSPWAAR